MLRLVIFDFDGVITDTEPAHFAMIQRICSEEGIDLTWSQYKEQYLGYPDSQCFACILANNGQKAEQERIDDLVKRKERVFVPYIKDNCPIFSGVGDLLADLEGNNIICSIYSGSLIGEIELILEITDLRKYFKVIVSTDDVTQDKPHPEGYELCLARTNAVLKCEPTIQAEQCIVIEDSPWGIQSAKEAQMTCLAVATTYEADKLTSADKFVPDLTHVDTNFLAQMLT